jgi:hypothetical protein
MLIRHLKFMMSKGQNFITGRAAIKSEDILLLEFHVKGTENGNGIHITTVTAMVARATWSDTVSSCSFLSFASILFAQIPKRWQTQLASIPTKVANNRQSPPAWYPAPSLSSSTIH